MKKISIILFFFFSLSFLYSASIDSGLIDVRDDLFNSQEELESFYYLSELTKEEEEYYQDMEVFLLTGGPGSLVWENFGHSSFVLKVPNGEEISFDYGIFSFDKGFYTNFALGRLYYSMLVSYAHYRVSSLIDDDRTVQYLKLDLDNIQKCNLARFLEYNAKSGNNVYLYNYYTDNCATRLRDSYNAVTDNRFRLWAEKEDMNETLRDYSKRYLSSSGFIIDWGINYLLGPSVDRKITLWEAMFLPDVLNNAISEFQNNTPELIYKSENRNDTPMKYNFFLYSILLDLVFIVPIILLNSRKRNIRRVCDFLLFSLYSVVGILSSVLLFLMCASIHDAAYMNENVVILSPLLLVLAILHLIALGKKERRNGIRKLSIILFSITLLMLIIKLIPLEILVEDNIEYYILALAIYLMEFISNYQTKVVKSKRQ